MIELRDLAALVCLHSFLQDPIDASPQDVIDDAYYMADLVLQRRKEKDFTVGDKK